MLIGTHVAGGVAVYQCACVAGHEAADNGHALVAVFTVAGAIYGAVCPAVCHKTAVIKTDKAARLGKIAGGNDVGDADGRCAVDERALVLHTDNAADILVALCTDMRYRAGDIAAVNDSAGVISAYAAAVGIARDAADKRRGFIACIERNVCPDVFDDGVCAEEAEQADIEVFLIERAGSFLRAEGKARDAVALAVECAVKEVVAAADGRPVAGYGNVCTQRDVLAGVVDLFVHRAREDLELVCGADDIRVFLAAVAGGENGCIDIAGGPDRGAVDYRTAADDPVIKLSADT